MDASVSLLAEITRVTGEVEILAMIAGLAVCLWIMYQVLIKKNAEMKKKLTGLRGLTPAIMLAIMEFIPASVLDVFGPLAVEKSVTAIFSIVTAGLLGYILAWIILYVLDYIKPDILGD